MPSRHGVGGHSRYGTRGYPMNTSLSCCSKPPPMDKFIFLSICGSFHFVHADVDHATNTSRKRITMIVHRTRWIQAYASWKEFNLILCSNASGDFEALAYLLWSRTSAIHSPR